MIVRSLCRLPIRLGCSAALFLAAIGLCQPAPAADDPPGSLELLEQQAFQAAVKRVAPSVVRIETLGGLDPSGEIRLGSGPTTGTIVTADGYIVSSAFNFLNQPDSILVQLPNGSRKPARLVATDHNRLLVLLKVEPDGPLPVPEAAPESQMRVGQWTIAVGRTFDPKQTNTAVGILSALKRIWGRAIQTDAAVSPNNYGGPLVDIQGRVLGILMPMSPDSTSEIAGYEWYNSGIGFAVPFEDVQAVLPRLKKGKDLRTGVLGISFARNASNFEPPVIAAVHPNGPAAKAGLKVGDRIVSAEGRPITQLAQLKTILAKHYDGDQLPLTVLRDQKQLEVQAGLVGQLEPYAHPFLGILPLRDSHGKDSKSSGVAVRYVYPQSPASRAGIQPGDILLNFDGKPVTSAEQLRQAISEKTVAANASLSWGHADKTKTASVQLQNLPESLPPDPLPVAWAGQNAPPQPDSPNAAPKKAERPRTGLFSMRLPDFPNEAWAYVPENYDPATPCGLCVWLHAPGGFDEKRLLERWKAHCDRDRLILLAPKAADPNQWQLHELILLDKLQGELASGYSIDPTRIVIAGRQAGGTLAYLAAFQHPERVRGVAAIDAPLPARPPEPEPLRRLAFFLAQTPAAAKADDTSTAASRLRKARYPVTLKELGVDPETDGLPDLARWIDTLDRI